MQMTQDYYKVLGIAPNASVNEIKNAYRRLAFQCHPDRNQSDPTSNRKMEEINEAYATLSDPVKRRKYDTPLEYRTTSPKFNPGDKVRIISRSSPYSDRWGLIDKPPFSDTFRFWYIVKFEFKGLTMVSQFAEEELRIVEE
jgi:curved DNA-binding protein CbpA